MSQRGKAPSGADYPRKRTAIACEICRARRSKCDARKPACSKCIELEVGCVYRKPNLWDREPVTAAATAALNKVDERLDHIQDSIAVLVEQVGSIPGSRPREPEYTSPVGISPQSNSTYHCRIATSSYEHPSGSKPRGHRLPNLMSFTSPASLGAFSYDSSQQFFTDEVEHGNRLYNCLEKALRNDLRPDFSTQKCWRLQRAFVSGFLRWMPIFDDEACFQHVQNASSTGFGDESLSTCLTLLMLAIGEMAADECLYYEEPAQLPGFEYMALGYKILQRTGSYMGSVEHLQCRCLFSAYLSFSMRPVQAWIEINNISRECMLLLKMSWNSTEPNSPDLKARVFWMTWVIENELEVSLELPSSGLRDYQDIVPLPTSSMEEEGLYFFLALISLRKLLAQVIDTIGFKFGQALYVPIVALELRSQCLSWHDHLPAALQFPLDASPLFDLRKAHLRGQLFCLLSVIYWPFMLKHVENAAAYNEIDAERTTINEGAKECVECCILHLKASEGLMMQKTLVSHAALRAFYAMTMVLLLAYQPVYHCPPPPDVAAVIKRSLEILSLWDKVQFMTEPINRIYCFATEVGILPPLRNI